MKTSTSPILVNPLGMLIVICIFVQLKTDNLEVQQIT